MYILLRRDKGKAEERYDIRLTKACIGAGRRGLFFSMYTYED